MNHDPFIFQSLVAASKSVWNGGLGGQDAKCCQCVSFQLEEWHGKTAKPDKLWVCQVISSINVIKCYGWEDKR